MIWIFVPAIIIVILFLVDREIYFYEATHLGPRVQGWLYNRWARKYDQDKHESQLHDAEMLARPVLDTLTNVPHALVLDFATGTGRFPFALLSESRFNGHILALDISEGMLEQAAQKLDVYKENVTLIRKIDLPLPFPDNTFDVVSCMEALEIMSEMEAPLKELFRVLRPGGLLITSRATEESGRKAKVKSKAGFTNLLQAIGIDEVEITTWWRIFDRVLAHKPGTSSPSVRRDLEDVLRCPVCEKVNLVKEAGQLKCSNCDNVIPINLRGVVLF